MDPLDYQYCEAQDIPIEYLEGYQEQPKPKMFDWKVLFISVFFGVLALLVLIITFALLIIFGVVHTMVRLIKQIKPPKHHKTYHFPRPFHRVAE